MSQMQTAVASEGSVSEAVIESVAKAEGVPPTELAAPLYESVDPEALEKVFEASPRAGRMEGQITFPYCGYEVTVAGDGYVSVEPNGE